eukprot:TRINITY_DN10377_c0_g1_i1.p2 TRINITY_DN10377_c0_g1~~TRINITY_DN10377_c0_g1_i1.p2  ORF type:complete len:364 (+),score=100.48 TRINITY_DN10377_c0_g1_i1:1728-2819(+)
MMAEQTPTPDDLLANVAGGLSLAPVISAIRSRHNLSATSLPDPPSSLDASLATRPELLDQLCNQAASRSQLRWRRCVLQRMMCAHMGIATPRDEEEASRTASRHASVSSSLAGLRRSMSRPPSRDGLSDDGDDDQVEDLTFIEAPASLMDALGELNPAASGAVLASAMGSMVLGAGSLVGKAASSVFSNTLGRAGGVVLSGAAALKNTLTNNLTTVRRLREEAQESTDADMSPEEREILEAKMAEMERVLAEELAALQEQEVDLYVEKFNEAVEMEARLKAIEEAMHRENQEVLLQRQVMEIERREAELNPEPDDTRPTMSAGDDHFTKSMRETGLIYKAADGGEKVVTQADLPPPLDLTEFM